MIEHRRIEESWGKYGSHPDRVRQRGEEMAYRLMDPSVGRLSDRDRYELIFGACSMGFWDWDLEANKVYFSAAWKSMIGCLNDEIGTDPEEWFTRIHPEDSALVRSAIKAHVEGISPVYDCEYRMLHSDGTYRWMLCRGIAARNGQGEVYRVGGVQIDISERRFMEEELKSAMAHAEEKSRELALSNERLRTVLDSSEDAVATFDSTGRLVIANQRYMEIFELSAQDLEDASVLDIWQHTGQRFREPGLVKESIESLIRNPGRGVEQIVEMKMPRPGHFHHSMRQICDNQGNVIGFITVLRDLTREMEVERMRAEVFHLRSQLEEGHSFANIIGNSAKMRTVYELMHRAIESDITVLIQGESGTGKELAARSIHFNSERKNGPLIAVNCAAIPETLIESELFGHERGAFTGAMARRIGRFEQANGGTILLDEIGEMSPSIQAVLLRVLEERRIQRVGGIESIPVDVRIIALTNKDLEGAIEAGEFREDLYYRIAVFPITVPALRENREDIPLLAVYFLERATKKAGKSIAVFSSEVMECFVNYDWPGNVRQLENAIDRAVLLEESDMIQLSSIPSVLPRYKDRFAVIDPQNGSPTSSRIPTLEEVEKRLFKYALEMTNHNIAAVARALGVGRVTVYRKLEKYNLLDGS